MSNSNPQVADQTSPTIRVPGGAIDVHTHFMPDGYAPALKQAGLYPPDNITDLPEWDAPSTVESMDALGVAHSMISISSPGVWLPSRADTVDLGRQCNDVGAAAVAEFPDRLGFFAALPLPYVDDALDELTRAFDELGANGVALMTNSDGQYVGDPACRPLLEELDRRKAVVLLHPASPPNHGKVSFGRPIPMIEFPFETTRTVVDLILSGAVARFPQIRWIIPHAGSALPVLASRVAFVSNLLGSEGAGVDVNGALRSFHYDVAGVPLPVLLPALVAVVGADRLLYGSDTPFTPTAVAAGLADQLNATDVLDDAGRVTLFRSTAESLFPHLSI